MCLSFCQKYSKLSLYFLTGAMCLSFVGRKSATAFPKNNGPQFCLKYNEPKLCLKEKCVAAFVQSTVKWATIFPKEQCASALLKGKVPKFCPKSNGILFFVLNIKSLNFSRKRNVSLVKSTVKWASIFLKEQCVSALWKRKVPRFGRKRIGPPFCLTHNELKFCLIKQSFSAFVKSIQYKEPLYIFPKSNVSQLC